MRILISGSHGLIGSALFISLQKGGHELSRLMRQRAGPGDIEWHPDQSTPPTESLEGFDAVVHLAGESIASGRWTEARKQKIRDSRVQGTTRLSKALTSLREPPRVLV